MNKIKQVDRKIVVGLSLTVLFLILWLITLPLANKDKDIVSAISSGNQLSDSSDNSLNETTKAEIYNLNLDNFNKALLYGNSSLCDSITNKTMRKECREITPDKVVIIEHIEETPKISQADTDNYNKALLYQDKLYCNNIADEKLKEDCHNLMIDVQI